MRVNRNANEDIARATQRLKDILEKQSELQATMIRGMRRKDAMERQLQSFQAKETKWVSYVIEWTFI